MDPITLYSTWPDLEAANAAARALVERRLAACVTVLPGAVSTYRWEGEIEVDSEVVMFAKTTGERAAEARDALLDAIPTNCPAWSPCAWTRLIPTRNS